MKWQGQKPTFSCGNEESGRWCYPPWLPLLDQGCLSCFPERIFSWRLNTFFYLKGHFFKSCFSLTTSLCAFFLEHWSLFVKLYGSFCIGKLVLVLSYKLQKYKHIYRICKFSLLPLHMGWLSKKSFKQMFCGFWLVSFSKSFIRPFSS